MSVIMNDSSYIQLRELLSEVAGVEIEESTISDLLKKIESVIISAVDIKQKNNLPTLVITNEALNGDEIDQYEVSINDKNLQSEYIVSGYSIFGVDGAAAPVKDLAPIDTNEFLYNLDFSTNQSEGVLGPGFFSAVKEGSFSSITNCIKSYSFCNNQDISEVCVPANIKRLGDHAFHGCHKLATVVFDSNSLTGGTFNNGSGYSPGLGEAVFCDCPNLSNCILPNNVSFVQVSTLPAYTFFGCKSLSTIGEENFQFASIGEGALSHTKISKLQIIPAAFTLPSEILTNCSNFEHFLIQDANTNTWIAPEFLELPAVTKIGKFCFTGCNNFSQVIVGNNVTEIDDYAFMNSKSGLRTDDPSKITKLGKAAFANTALQVFEDQDGAEANEEKSRYGFNISQISELAVTEIPDSCFQGALAPCLLGQGRTIDIPAKVKNIGRNAFSTNVGINVIRFAGWPFYIAENAFSGCDKIIYGTQGKTYHQIREIRVPWYEGAIAGAPWGATQATVYYNQV